MAHAFVAMAFSTAVFAGGQPTPRDAAIARATTTLAEQAAVTADRLTLVDAVEAEWRDSSLGCPQPGMVYAQVITSGYRVTFRRGDDRFIVHATADRAVICKAPRAAAATGGRAGAGSGDKTPTAADAVAGLRLSEQARADLASRLGVDNDRVTITRYRQTTWSDASLGCAVNGEIHPPQPTRGFVIELASGGRSYEYHSDMTRVVACPGAAGR